MVFIHSFPSSHPLLKMLKCNWISFSLSSASTVENKTQMGTETQMSPSFPGEALQHVLSFIDSHADRNSLSLVCKSWYDIERWCRPHVFIGNCYAVSPPILVRRFSNFRSITIKGKHHLADYDFVPEGWGAHALPWIAELAAKYPALEEIRLKRMVVTDEGLELISRKLKNLKVLVLHKCEGFSTDGLASIAANCRNLRMLDLWKSEVDDLGGDLISLFPDSFTSLEFLNVDCLKSELPFATLERLAGKCPNLNALRLNHSFPLEKLVNLLLKAPQLADLGIGLLTMEPCQKVFTMLAMAFAGCKGVKSLSGLWDVNPYYLPAIYPVCLELTSLNLSCSALRCSDLVKLLRRCPKLRRLWVLDYIEDRGLEEVAASCKELEELRVFYSDAYDADPNSNLTERGLVFVVKGCPKLRHVIYFCSQMTNEALLTIAKHSPNLTKFLLVIGEPQLPDFLTDMPLDNGYSAILERCKNLEWLVVSGLFTDRLLEHIGTHGKKLEMLSLIFSCGSDRGLHHVLSGCINLRKLFIRDSPFGGQALLANSDKLERMRSILISSCNVGYRECKLLGEKHPRLNVEVFNERGPLHSMTDESHVENLYVYRTVAGPRLDMPEFVSSTSRSVTEGI